MVTATGWTHKRINKMLMCDVVELLDYWGENPPAHLILGAVYLKKQEKRGNRDDLMALIGQMGGQVRRKAKA